MRLKHDRPTHALTLTEFDEAHLPIYLFVIDAINAVYDWKFVAKELWGNAQPKDAEGIVSDFVKRAKWMTTEGYKHLWASSPEPRDKALDELVRSGAMSPAERAFLDSEEGEKFWPRPKH